MSNSSRAAIAPVEYALLVLVRVAGEVRGDDVAEFVSNAGVPLRPITDGVPRNHVRVQYACQANGVSEGLEEE